MTPDSEGDPLQYIRFYPSEVCWMDARLADTRASLLLSLIIHCAFLSITIFGTAAARRPRLPHHHGLLPAETVL